MNEEIMMENNEVEETTMENVPEIQESESGGFVGKLAVGVIGAGVAVAALYKNRHKISEWHDKHRIEALEKKGYRVDKIDNVIDITDETEEAEEEE